jgi:hypothetical protein
MRDIKTHTGTLQILKRLPSSTSGNPRYLLLIGDTVCQTSVDSSLAYSVPNYEGYTVEATIGTHYGKATLNTITKAENYDYL